MDKLNKFKTEYAVNRLEVVDEDEQAPKEIRSTSTSKAKICEKSTTRPRKTSTDE